MVRGGGSLLLGEFKHPAGILGACEVPWIGLRVKNAGIINGGETQQLKAMKGGRNGPRVKYPLGVEFQTFKPNRDREIESPAWP